MKDFHSGLPDVMRYSDYRLYLGDVYRQAKALDSRFSYRYFAAQAGIHSSSFLKYVIEGKRNLSRTTLLKVASALKLPEREAEAFEALVLFNQARSLKEKNTWFARIIALRGAGDAKPLAAKQLDLFSDWRHTALRELLHCTGGEADPSRLAKALRPEISSAQAAESLRLLLQLGLVQADDRGRVRPSDAVVSTGPKHPSHTVANYQRRMLQLAQEAFDRWPQEERLMSATTFSISEAAVELFRRRLRECRTELMEWARHDERPDRVWHLNLSFFPLSEAVESVRPLAMPPLLRRIRRAIPASLVAAAGLALIACLGACLGGGATDTETVEPLLQGRLTDTAGHPLPGGRVKLLPHDHDPSAPGAASALVLPTDASGEFAAPDTLPPGAYRLVGTDAQGGLWGTLELEWAGAGPQRFALAAGRPKVYRVTLAPDVYAPSDSGVAFFPGTDILARCDGGRAEIIDSVPSGLARFVARSRAGWERDGAFTVATDTVSILATADTLTVNP